MEERDTFPFRAEPRRLVDQSKASLAAPCEGTVEVVDREADVMDARTAFGDELADGRVRVLGLEQLDECVTRGNAGEQVAVEWQDLVERTHGDADVGDTRGTAGDVGHVSALVKRGAGAEF